MRKAFGFKSLLVFSAMFMSVHLEAASFDCTKASTPVEKMICADAELSKLDEQLNKVYQKVLAAATDPYKSAFKQQQRAWLKENRSRCGDADCLRSMYHSRIQHWDSFRAELASHKELPKLPDVVTYADIRTDVTVEKLPKQPAWEKPRPANFFQLAGSANKALCDATLAAFNEQAEDPPATYRYIVSLSSPGSDHVRWLLYNAHEVQFQSLEPGIPLHSFSGLEYARIDLDRDDKPEHVYRTNTSPRSVRMQDLMIVSESLQDRPDLLKIFEAECRWVFRGSSVKELSRCSETNTQIHYAFTTPYPEKRSLEWVFTSGGPIQSASRDSVSSSLVWEYMKGERPRMTRNIGTNHYWSLYKINKDIVVVSAPVDVFAPPELFVFIPKKDQPGSLLQCILMPGAWYKFDELN